MARRSTSASNGQTLPGYDQARIELAQRGQTELPPAQESGGFFALAVRRWRQRCRRRPTRTRRIAAPRSPAPRRRRPPPCSRCRPSRRWLRQPQPAPQPEQAQIQAPVPAQPETPPTAAIAYAPQAPEQPLDGRVQVDPQAPIAGQSGLGQQQTQVASVDPAVVDPATPMPMPPRRPADLAAAADVPLPPVRPATLVALATTTDATTTAADSASDLPLRPSTLPPLIAGDDAARAPAQALAFVGEPVASLEPRFALRRHREAAATVVARAVPASDAAAERAIIGGPQLTGLRRAAHQLADNSAP